MGAGGGGHVLGQDAARDSGHKRSRVHGHIPHPGEIDDEPVVAHCAPRPVVPAAAHRQRQAVTPRGAHRACTSSACSQIATIAARRRTAPFHTRQPLS